MARNGGYSDTPTRGNDARVGGIPEDGPEFRRAPGGARTRLADEIDPRLLDLEPEEESPFLRASTRVPVRRGPLGSRRTANRLKYATLALVLVGVVGVFVYFLYNYGAHSWRFRIESGDDLEIAGLEHVSRGQVMEVFGGDIGRNIFFVPLDERRRELEKIPWVESATVMRLLPHRLRVSVRERVPVAFAQVGSRAQLIDANGVLMDMPAAKPGKFSFPVVAGMAEAEPLSTRAARMKIFSIVMRELDSGGARYSDEISEMDLSNPEDVKVTVADPGGAVLVHLGSSDYLERFKIFKAHVQEWRRQFQKLNSVDLRYERQVIVNGDAVAAVSVKAAAPAVTAAKSKAKAPPRSKRKR